LYDEFPTADMTHDVLAHYFWWGPWTLPHPSRLVCCTKDVKFLLLLLPSQTGSASASSIDVRSASYAWTMTQLAILSFRPAYNVS